MSEYENQENESENSEWDEQWVRIREMPMGGDDPFSEFADEVRAAMEAVGNEVERPLVMRVTIEAVDGEIARPDTDNHE